MLVRTLAGEALGSDAYSHLVWARDAVRHGVTSHTPFDYTVPKPFAQGVAALGTKLGAATFVFEWTSLAGAFACAAAAAALARRVGTYPAAPLAALFTLCLPVLWRGGPLGDSNVPYAALVVGCRGLGHRHADVRRAADVRGHAAARGLGARDHQRGARLAQGDAHDARPLGRLGASSRPRSG